ncbi:copper chaperone PCu(A)C [Microbulbifer agarilyticus]|uniref:copper chaperone PCu(A)C n=1 Tax=Microbulbifer agarilyticus TaxID=260552 RepID=UPI001CD28F89|nr:copper chaperone PCu(A)C [Microbulbifer agarilyticus]MCA0900458.1 copper chaperone PCu(A)C [Microbulbifer agarilyticus]
MKNNHAVTGLLRGIVLLSLFAAGAIHASESSGQRTVEQLSAVGYAREMPPGAPMGAAYLALQNLSASEYVLERIELPAHPEGRVELHTTLHEGGVSKMRALEKLALPAQASIEMRPGATHLMVHGVRLKAGAQLPVKLVFADGSSYQFSLPVLEPNDVLPAGMSTEVEQEGHHHHHGHHGHG